MKPQVLTLKNVKAKARKAYEERRLTAQAKKRDDRVCRYRIGNFCCAVGAALSLKTLSALERSSLSSASTMRANEMSVDYIIEREFVAADPAEKKAIEEIQKAHDAWAKATRHYGLRDALSREARNHFLALIEAY